MLFASLPSNEMDRVFSHFLIGSKKINPFSGLCFIESPKQDQLETLYSNLEGLDEVESYKNTPNFQRRHFEMYYDDEQEGFPQENRNDLYEREPSYEEEGRQEDQ